MKTIELKNAKLTQEPKVFKNDKGEEISYSEYVLHIEGRKILVRSNQRGKVYLEDFFLAQK